MGLLTELVEKGWLLGDIIQLKKDQIDQIKKYGSIIVNVNNISYKITIKNSTKNIINEFDLDVKVIDL